MGSLDLLSECEKVFESLKHVIIVVLIWYVKLNFRSCGGDKRAVNIKVMVYISF